MSRLIYSGFMALSVIAAFLVFGNTLFSYVLSGSVVVIGAVDYGLHRSISLVGLAALAYAAPLSSSSLVSLLALILAVLAVVHVDPRPALRSFWSRVIARIYEPIPRLV